MKREMDPVEKLCYAGAIGASVVCSVTGGALIGMEVAFKQRPVVSTPSHDFPLDPNKMMVGVGLIGLAATNYMRWRFENEEDQDNKPDNNFPSDGFSW